MTQLSVVVGKAAR